MEPIISFTGVSKVFKTREQKGWKSLFRANYIETVALNQLDLELQPGEVYGLIGENGAGKSTLIKLLTGILHPDGGTIKVLGLDPFDHRKDLMRKVGVIFGQRSLLRSVIPVRYSLEWLAGLHGIPEQEFNTRLAKLAERLEVEDLLDKPPRNLSLGQKRRCDLLASLLHQPKLLLLDEPEIGLDYKVRANFRSMLTEYARDQGITVIISSHDLGSLEQYCTEYIILNRGQLLFHGDQNAMRQKFSPKTVIKLKIHQQHDDAIELEAEVVDEDEQHVKLYVDMDIDLDQIITACYARYEIETIDIQSNSLEQILVGK